MNGSDRYIKEEVSHLFSDDSYFTVVDWEKELVNRVLRKSIRDTDEFLAPGISKARHTYDVLQDFYDTFVARLIEEGFDPLYENNTIRIIDQRMRKVRSTLQSMQTNLQEASDGYSLRYELYSHDNMHEIIGSFVFVAKYLWRPYVKFQRQGFINALYKYLSHRIAQDEPTN